MVHEKLRDRMHRILVQGHQGNAMLAISAIDCGAIARKGTLARPAGLPPAWQTAGGSCLCLDARLRGA